MVLQYPNFRKACTCETCKWVGLEGLQSEDEWRSELTAEMARLEQGEPRKGQVRTTHASPPNKWYKSSLLINRCYTHRVGCGRLAHQAP